MRAADLKLSELFDFKPGEGVIRFRDGRMLMMDAESIGRLRELLITFLGPAPAMAILAHYGYVSGYYDALKLEKMFEWDTEMDWVAAGPVMHTLEGIVHVTPKALTYDREKKLCDMHGEWRNSYEAELHLANFGKSDKPACWTQTGYASGYATAFMGFDCICIEEKCVARGDDVCYWRMRKKEDWADDKVAAEYVRALELLTTKKPEFFEELGRHVASAKAKTPEA